jgi:DNA-binding PadR family transcriptional regulator
MHPYAVQRLIKDWGKDQVVNVSQRASLYRTIDRLRVDGLIAVREVGRDQAYPERTVYEITEEGRRTARDSLVHMLCTPKREFPQFPAALAHLLLITPEEALPLVEQRARQLAVLRAGLAAELEAAARRGLPRVTVLETEYLHAVAATEEAWLASVTEDLRTGRLTWSTEEMAAFDHATDGLTGPG